MLQKIFSKPVALNIGGKTITFHSMDDFEFALNARTAVPLGKVNDAINATLSDLELETNAIDVAIEQLTELNEQFSETGEITQRLKGINPVIFSNDNDWRDIFFALKKDQSSESSLYKQKALEAYLQYLINRKDMIQTAKTQLKKDNSPKEKEERNEAPKFRTGELDIDDKFDAKALGKELGMTSLQKEEPVSLEVNEGDEIELLLANYECKLVVKDGITFIDHEDAEYPIENGENKVGRGSECAVRFTDTTQRISRLHLLIKNHNNKKLELIDFSTYGTHYLLEKS